MRSSILYTCLLRTNIGGSSANSLLLAEHTEYVGNFDRYVLLYLSAAGINGYHGSFIVEENYRIVYVTQASYAVAVLCDVSFPASLAICHADEVLSTFMRDFFDKAQNAIRRMRISHLFSFLFFLRIDCPTFVSHFWLPFFSNFVS
eukprot:TRINITY_DN1281_c0_g1_i3.p1 TRINITY_DN1281_c0_g1~~TRINITY_DN1281_c0_g1_i3.p1  ORF type:complete len:146 (+),score=21.33 TRINITY_DN1281_c0_g1_i3:110-547(+)